jgi:hypothetical protein
LWLFAVGAGLRVLLNYENTAGETGPVPAEWPATSRLQPNPQHSTLVVFAHPNCPCTRASIGELEAIMARVGGQVSAYVVFLKPHDHPGEAEEWEHGGLWRRAAAIPGVTVLRDDSGTEGAHFGATVSGQALLYDRKGHLRFNGGITAVRGHSGDSAGRQAIIAFATTGNMPRPQTPVFGCALQDPSTLALESATSWKKDTGK